MRKQIVFASLFTLLFSLGSILAASPEQEVRNAEKQWAAAVMALDFPALEKIISDDLLYAHSTGVVQSKSEYLGKLRSGDQKYDVIRYKKLSVKVFGDAAVAHSIVIMQGNTKGVPFDNELMMMQIWAKQGGRWRLVAHQPTRLNK